MRFLSTISLLLLTIAGYAQQYNFTRYSIEEGLPRASVYSVYEDTEGFIWVGVDGGGVCVFDGHEFITYDTEDGLASNTIRTVFQDHGGNMWFGTQDRGASRFDGKEFTTYDLHDGLPNNTIRAIAQDESGNIWFGTLGGGVCLLNVDSGEFTTYDEDDGLASDKVRCLLFDKEGNMWIGTDGGLTMYNGKTFVTYDEADGLPHDKVLTLFQDRDDNLWIGTQDGLAYFQDRKRFLVYTEDNGLVHNRIKSISQDFQGRIWIGTREGVSMFDRHGFHTYTKEEGLSNERIRSIICDSGGNLWFGTYFGGVSKFTADAFVHYTEQEGLINDQVLSIYEDNNGHILLGTYNGVSKLKFDENAMLNEVVNITTQDGLCNNVVNVVYKDWGGYYWYCTDGGVTIADKDRLSCITMEDGLVDDIVISILQTDTNEYWLGTYGGVSRVRFNAGHSDYDIQNFTMKEGLGGSEVSAIHQDAFGNIWFGFMDGGMSVYKDEEFLMLQLPNKLNSVISIRTDRRETMWIATHDNGIYTLENDNKLIGELNFKKTYLHDELISHVINSLEFDDPGNLWVGTTKGISKITFDDTGKPLDVENFGKNEGFVGIETTMNSIYIDQRGSLWFGTINGATRYSPSHDIKNEIEPCTHITSIRLFYETIDWDNSPYADTSYSRFHIPENLVLPYNVNHVTFGFVGVSLAIPSKVRYKWQLVGVDEQPTSERSIDQATYTNLDPGEYTFKVWASNHDGVWNEEPAVFHFTITAPFWQKWWFIGLAILIGIGIFQLISGIRTRQLRKAKEMLEGEVRARTQEISEQNQQLEVAFMQLDEKNTAITDSINYAQRIQSAIMRPAKELDSRLMDRMFILYKPKDIVSGDFFWFMDADDKTFVTAADCTGHGVPGAFMSMIGITFLNEIVGKKHIYQPAMILNELRSSVLHALHVEGEDNKDGMDISFSCIDWKRMKLEWAGANNPVVVIRDGVLHEIKGDKMPVGKHDNDEQPFTNHEFDLQEGDMIYMYSDGYPDQFGGETGKKFMARNFKRYLQSICNEEIMTQKAMLDQNIIEWQGTHEQIDDILVMGIRIS